MVVDAEKAIGEAQTYADALFDVGWNPLAIGLAGKRPMMNFGFALQSEINLESGDRSPMQAIHRVDTEPHRS